MRLEEEAQYAILDEEEDEAVELQVDSFSSSGLEGGAEEEEEGGSMADRGDGGAGDTEIRVVEGI